MRYGPSAELLILFWIITLVALVDAIRVPNNGDYRAGTKVIWVLVILFLNVLGAVLYYAVGKPRRR
jgi:hypothetical protein